MRRKCTDEHPHIVIIVLVVVVVVMFQNRQVKMGVGGNEE